MTFFVFGFVEDWYSLSAFQLVSNIPAPLPPPLDEIGWTKEKHTFLFVYSYY